MTADEAAALIPDGAVVTVSSSSALGCPDRMLEAIGRRFAATGHPHGLTTIHPIAAGDMYGVKGVDHLAQPGLLKRIIAGSYPSGASSLPSPAIWRMVGDDAVAAYNVPSGILYDMHRDCAAGRPGVLTKVGLDTFVDPRRDGCRMNRAAHDPIVHLVSFAGEEWLHFPNIPPTVAILRGTTADERGNVSMEHEGAFLGGVDQALAVKAGGGIVIAQVKRRTADGGLTPQRVHVPSTLVDVVVVDPDQSQTTGTAYDPAISGETRLPRSGFAAAPFGPDKVIARRAALELRNGDVVNLGFGISALVPGILVEEGRDDAVTWVIEQGAVGGVPLTGFAFGCAANAEAILPSPQMFTYFQSGAFGTSLLSFLEIDRAGNVNVSRLSAKPHVTAGAGGFVDITARARRLVFSGYFAAGGLDLAIDDGRLLIRRDGRFTKLVPEVEQVSFSGRRALDQGQHATFITERCVIELRDAGLTVVEVAPGVDLRRDVLGRAGIELSVDDGVKTMDPRLFRPEPVGLELDGGRVAA